MYKFKKMILRIYEAYLYNENKDLKVRKEAAV